MQEPDTRGLDPAWIAEAIRTEATPAVTFAGFIGTGQIGRNARFRVDWPAGEGPSSVVVKLPAADEGTRRIGFEQGLYPKECAFYRDLVDLVDVRTPTPLAVDLDPDALDFALVLEDLDGSEAGDQMQAATQDELAVAIEQAAALHGPLWGRDHPALDAFRTTPDERSSLMDVLGLFLPPCLDRLAGRLHPDTVPVLERFVPAADRWARRPHRVEGLVHSDFRPDNFLYGRRPDAPALAVVDWQTVALGAPVTDIAYLLGAAVDPARRRSIETDHLAAYRGHLARYDVDYDAGDCWDDYVLASFHGIVVGVLATIMATETDRGNELFALMLNRHARHVLDVDALDRLDDLD